MIVVTSPDAAGVSAAGVSAAGVSAAGVSAAGVSAAGVSAAGAELVHPASNEAVIAVAIISDNTFFFILNLPFLGCFFYIQALPEPNIVPTIT